MHTYWTLLTYSSRGSINILMHCTPFFQINSVIVPTKVLSDPLELESTLQSNLFQQQQSAAAVAAAAAAAASNGYTSFNPVTQHNGDCVSVVVDSLVGAHVYVQYVRYVSNELPKWISNICSIARPESHLSWRSFGHQTCSAPPEKSFTLMMNEVPKIESFFFFLSTFLTT